MLAPLAAGAQQPGKVYRVGQLFNRLPTDPPGQGPFYERMRELGWAYGRDFVAEHRALDGQYERVPGLAAELIRRGVDVFVVQGGSEAARIQEVTRTIPIVTSMAGDLVAMGLAASLARPGGNVTGIQTLQPQLAGKHLSLLKEAIPRLSRCGVLHTGSSSSRTWGTFAAALREAETAGKALDIALQVLAVQAADELEKAFSTLQAGRAQGIVILRDNVMGAHVATLVELALKHRLPSISDMPGLAARGGLMSYGYNFDDAVRAAAGIVDKILRGAKISEIPVQQATAFRLVINLVTAKALGLTIPPSLLVQADQVIE